MATVSGLTQAAGVLARAAPREYEDFLQAFYLEAEQCRTDLVQAASTDILSIQGQAKKMMQLLRWFDECRSLGQKPAEKKVDRGV